MCVVLDNSAVSEVFGDNRPPAGAKFFDWIDSGRGRLIGGGQLLHELAQRGNFRLWWLQAVGAGVARQVDDNAVRAETMRLTEKEACQSNDAHVIALAVVGGARLLYTNDRRLQDDFKDQQLIDGPPGKVYSTLGTGRFTRRKRELLATSSCRLDEHDPQG